MCVYVFLLNCERLRNSALTKKYSFNATRMDLPYGECVCARAVLYKIARPTSVLELEENEAKRRN